MPRTQEVIPERASFSTEPPRYKPRVRPGQVLKIKGSVALEGDDGSVDELRGASARVTGRNPQYTDSKGRERVSVELEDGRFTTVPIEATSHARRSSFSMLSDAGRAAYRRIFGHE